METARHNIEVYEGFQLCKDVDVVTMDFTDFKLPDEPLFVFLYNPASLSLSRVLAKRLMRSIAQLPAKCAYFTSLRIKYLNRNLVWIKCARANVAAVRTVSIKLSPLAIAPFSSATPFSSLPDGVASISVEKHKLLHPTLLCHV